MQVKILGGTGLHASERRAVAKMEAELRDSWFAYASLLIADDQGSMDVDTLIITHDRLLLVELKEWNGTLESSDGKWFINGRSRGKSPYETKRVHAIRLTKLLQQELKHKLGYYPLVEAHVVLCGNATPENFTTGERRFVHTLDEFLKIRSQTGYEQLTADQKNAIYMVYERLGKPRPNSDACLPVFQEFFAGPRIKPKDFQHFNYTAEQNCWYEHRVGLYQEFKGHHQETPNLQALMRRWDFNRLGVGNATQDQWASIALRESRVLNHVKANNNKLEDYMLRPLVPLTVEDVTEDVTELYELRRTYRRLDEFIVKEAAEWSIEKRADIVRALIVPFAELHGLGLGHRDIDGHNLWYAEEQSSVIVSGFATAFFPERGTISDLRAVLQSSYLKIPEDEFGVDGEILDPFRQDVFMLAVISYQICFDGKMLLKDEGIHLWGTPNADPFDGVLNNWFERALSWEIEDRFANASEFLAEFNALTKNSVPTNDDKHEVMDSLMEGEFVKRGWNTFTLYQKFPPEPGANPGTGAKMVYRSRTADKSVLCKIWPQIQATPDTPGLNRRLLQFKKRAELLRGGDLPTVQVHDYGLLESGGLFIVTEYVDGEVWAEKGVSKFYFEEKIDLGLTLISALLRFHHRGITHGDLHSHNILIHREEIEQESGETQIEFKITLLDMLDFGENSEPYNVDYGPTNPAVTDAYGRDRFAVYKLIEELFSDDHPLYIEEEISLVKKCQDGVPVSLEPLLSSIERCASERKKAPDTSELEINISWGSSFFPSEIFTIEKDGESYYFNCRWDNRNSSQLNCYITGINEQLHICLNPENREIKTIKFKNNIPLSEVVSAASKSKAAITSDISVVKGHMEQGQEKALIDLIFSLDPVLDALANKYSQEDSSAHAGSKDNESAVNAVPPIKIWQALADTEQDLLLAVRIEEGEIEESPSGRFLVPYSQQHSMALNFEADELVFVSIQGDESQIGELDIYETNLDVLAIKPTRTSIRHMLRRGIELNLESVRSKASRDRRAKALTRVVDNEAVIHNLIDYFDVKRAPNPSMMLDIPGEQALRDLYDTEDKKTNPKQILAFQKLLSEGPVGALQGPPGTGKTTFISEFIHYLYAYCSVDNILLVGQSHTAVDNVAVKAREVCSSKGHDIQIVRIGHETMIDEELLHAHPSAIQRQIRHKFHREYDLRIRSLGRQLLLPDTLVDDLTSLHRTVGPLLESRRHYLTLIDNEKRIGSTSDAAQIRVGDLISAQLQIERNLSAILDSRFQGNLQVDFLDLDIWDALANFVAVSHGVNNPAALMRLKGLLHLSQEWMDVLRTGEANYDRFLVKSKQLVCGTLVGMGLKRIAIEDVDFDWVIVDEAGRAQASELMIALQSAKRVLLVGDHCQLPPYYEREHINLAAKNLACSTDVFNESDFERIFNSTTGVTLDTQYRMVKPICDVVSHCFYGPRICELKTGRGDSPDWYAQLPEPWSVPVTWIDSGSGDRTGEEEIARGRYVNRNEMKILGRILELLCSCETIDNLRSIVSKEQQYPIGIITMYRAQKELIESEISKAEWAAPIRNLIKIDTVDSYQGKENKIIILSLVRDNRKSIQGFLGDSPRINVAISRAQERLIILGANRMWRKNNSDSALGNVYEFINGRVGKGDKGYQCISSDEVCEVVVDE